TIRRYGIHQDLRWSFRGWHKNGTALSGSLALPDGAEVLDRGPPAGPDPSLRGLSFSVSGHQHVERPPRLGDVSVTCREFASALPGISRSEDHRKKRPAHLPLAR